MSYIYDAIYKLKVGNEIEKGWYKLKWRPIWKGTYYVYTNNPMHWFKWKGHSLSYKLSCFLLHNSFGVGFHCYRSDATNGWGRSYKHFHFGINIGWKSIDSWIAWKFQVMAKGPQDVADKDKRPLNLGKE